MEKESFKIGGMDKWKGRFLCENSDNFEKIQALSSGLDAESQRTLFRLLGRFIKAHNHPNNDIFETFNEAEITELRELKCEFETNVVRCSPDVWGYNGYFLPVGHFEAEIFWHKYGLNELSSQTRERIAELDFIDAGAYVGDSAVMFEREFTQGRVFAFEAVRENFELMQKTLKLNNSTRVVPLNLALGASDGSAQITPNADGSSFVLGKTGGGEPVNVTTIDNFVSKNNLKIGFIKADIEGFEQELLNGAKETIFAQRPAMVISIYHTPSDFFDIKPKLERWGLGYRFKILRHADLWSIGNGAVLLCDPCG